MAESRCNIRQLSREMEELDQRADSSTDSVLEAEAYLTGEVAEKQRRRSDTLNGGAIVGVCQPYQRLSGPWTV